MFSRFFILIFLLALTDGQAQNKFTVRKDLSDSWLGYEEKKFYAIEPAQAINNHVIHFQLNPTQHRGEFLKIHSNENYFLFIDGKAIIENEGSLLLNVDSLSNRYAGRKLLISLYQENGIRARTEIVALGSHPRSWQTERKPPSDLKNFAAVAGLGLILFFVAMLTVHPKLSTEYFSIRRTLAMREVDDKEAHARFAVSSNFLFYLFLSLLLALLLVLLSPHLSEEYAISISVSDSYFVVTWQWIKLSVYILGIFLVKLLLVVSLSALFGMQGIAGIHFINSTRVLLVVASSLSAIAFVYFISGGRDHTIYDIFLLLLIFTLVAWVVLLFFKLSNLTDHSMFHLFSYICATEVIPLLLLMKVLFD